MSSSAPRSGERMIHQDFIARIRYSNALPPPPNPPKLLDIPNTGLSSGQYTTPGFASRLAREQPLNIEADAELGMPLDLVGMPGVFDGDESSIQAPVHPPAVHPHDRPLLRPIAALGKPKVAEANVSFLRRTEYISSATQKRQDASSAKPLFVTAKRHVRKPEPAADSPQAIKRKIDRSFELAEQQLRDPKRLKHPTNKKASVVSVYPLLPDLDAFPDSGAYVTVKFSNNPVSSSTEYDTRLLSGIFRPIDRTEMEEAAYEAALMAHEQDPINNPKPENLMNYDFYLGQSSSVASKFRAKFDVENPGNGEDELYTHEGERGGYFQFDRVRAYETYKETELDQAHKYEEEILLAFNDENTSDRQTAAYYYPVMQKSFIRPQRNKNIARTIGLSQEEEQIVDQLDLTVEEPTDQMKLSMQKYKEQPLGFDEELPNEETGATHEMENQNERARLDQFEGDVDEEAKRNGTGSVSNVSRSQTPSEGRDAPGEDDE